jgi:hypothetical protein
MRSAALAVASLALVVAACADAPTSPTERPSLAATTFTENLKIPTGLVVFVDCANGGAGELVLLDGDLHVLTHITANKNGFHIKSHFQPQGISGTGQTTGDKYQATGVTQDQFNLGPGETFTSINNFRIIGQGPGNNLLVHSTFHYTINANGELTVVVDNFRAECK